MATTVLNANLTVTLTDNDLNKNSFSGETIALSTTYNTTIPSLSIGSPISLTETSTFDGAYMNVSSFSKIATISSISTDQNNRFNQFTYPTTTVDDFLTLTNGTQVKVFLNFNVTSVVTTPTAYLLVDESGDAHTKSEGMYDLCKLCQVAAKNQLWERDHGRPISVSYRKALGLEGKERTAEYVVEGHKKKLAPNPGFNAE